MRDIWLIDEGRFPSTGTLEDQWRFLLRYAILAPSAYNSQPWLFSIKGGDCLLYVDPHRRMPAQDPLGHDAFLAVGACMENLLRAAQHFLVLDNWELFDGSDHGLVGRVRIRREKDEGLRETRLFSAIPRCFDMRTTFAKRPIPEPAVDALRQVVDRETVSLHAVTDNTRRLEIADTVSRGLRERFRDRSFRSEWSRWMHGPFSRRSVGLSTWSLGLPLVFSLVSPWMAPWINIGGWVAATERACMISGPLLCAFGSASSDARDIVRTGMNMQRSLLYLNSHGIRTALFTTAVHDQATYERIQRILGTDAILLSLVSAGFTEVSLRHSRRTPVDGRLVQQAPAE